MNVASIKSITKTLAAAALLSLGACASTESTTTAQAQTSVACRLCGKDVPPGEGVTATVTGERRVYRCIHCALTDLRDVPQLTLEARSGLSKRTIYLTRSEGVWTSEPATAVYLILPEHADECLDVHQPFADRREFDSYLAAHPDIARQNPQAFTISDYEHILEAGKPAGE